MTRYDFFKDKLDIFYPRDILNLILIENGLKKESLIILNEERMKEKFEKFLRDNNFQFNLRHIFLGIMKGITFEVWQGKKPKAHTDGEFGRALGYPICCIDNYIKHKDRLLSYKTALFVMKQNKLDINKHSLISHLPCCKDRIPIICDNTLELIQKYYSIAKKYPWLYEKIKEQFKGEIPCKMDIQKGFLGSKDFIFTETVPVINAGARKSSGFAKNNVIVSTRDKFLIKQAKEYLKQINDIKLRTELLSKL